MSDRSSDVVVVGDDGETFPLLEVLTGRGFVTGKSGSGKSNTASVIAEELLERELPLLIVDTDGEYYGLKAEFEMLQVGAGPNCDVDLGVDQARDIAELALVENVPIILDVSGFVEQSDAEALVDAVLKQLFVLENEHQKPFLVLVEELHEFVPEQQGLPDVGETITRIAKRGLGICGMSQRPAAVDKDYITQCNWLVWHRLTWDNDTRIVSQIMGGDAAETVQELGDGEALVMTDWDERTRRLQFRRKRTFNAGSTPSLDEDDRPSLKTVDSDLLDRLKSRAGKAIDDTPDDDADGTGESDSPDATAEAEEPASDGDTHDGSTAAPTSPGSGHTQSGQQLAEKGPLWEFGQLVWHLLVRAGRASRRGVRWLGARTAAALDRSVTWVRDVRTDSPPHRHGRTSTAGGTAVQQLPVPVEWLAMALLELGLLVLGLLVV